MCCILGGSLTGSVLVSALIGKQFYSLNPILSLLPFWKAFAALLVDVKVCLLLLTQGSFCCFGFFFSFNAVFG